MNLSLAVVCAFIATFADAQTPTLDGRYALVPERSADIPRAIDAAVADMNFIKRPIARGRLAKTNPPYQRLAISRTGERIVVTFDARKPVEMSADGHATAWIREDGERFDVTGAWQQTTLVQRFKAEDGERTNTFRLNDAGTELTLEVVIKSEQLPKPLTYSLVYRRDAAP